MITILLLLMAVAGFGLVAAWIGENPGLVTMTWFGYQIETSVAVLLLAALLVALLLTFAYSFLRKIILAPRHYSQYRSMKHYRTALVEITHSVAALAANDVTSATSHTRRAEKALGITPLTLLLRAQISKSEGSDDETRKLLEQLLEHPETEFLAAKSLSDVAKKQHQLPQALQLAERAHRVNPKESHGAWALFDLHLNTGHFQEAEIHARHARKTGAFSRADATTAKGKLALKQAESATTSGHKDHALMFACQAIKYLPGDVKAAETCAQLYVDNHLPEKALQTIQTQWKSSPSVILAQLFNHLIEDEKPEKKQKRIDKLVASNPAAPENVTLTS